MVLSLVKRLIIACVVTVVQVAVVETLSSLRFLDRREDVTLRVV